MVMLELNRTMIPMNQLQVGDRVLAVDPVTAQPTFSEVLMFMHRETGRDEDFVTINTASGTSTSLTPNHLIYVTRQDGTSDVITSGDADYVTNKKPVFASDVAPGHYVYTLLSNGSVTTSRVLSVSLGRRKDVLAPLTGAGNLVVDGAVASCYGVFTNEDIAHVAFLPVRTFKYFFPFSPSVCKSSEEPHGGTGVHWYAWLLSWIAEEFLPHNFMRSF